MSAFKEIERCQCKEKNESIKQKTKSCDTISMLTSYVLSILLPIVVVNVASWKAKMNSSSRNCLSTSKYHVCQQRALVDTSRTVERIHGRHKNVYCKAILYPCGNFVQGAKHLWASQTRLRVHLVKSNVHCSPELVFHNIELYSDAQCLSKMLL